MMKWLMALSALIWICLSDSQQNFQYYSSDSMMIQPTSNLQLTLELITASNEFLNENSINTLLEIQESSPLEYNLVYFLYSSAEGRQCFENWIVYGQTLAPSNCSQITDVFTNYTICKNYSGCQEELISLNIHLSQELYQKTFIFIENNSQNETIQINTSLFINLQSSNSWFYWGIGLICYLIISLVIYSGILFKMMLKYKSVTKSFEQFKLTEDSASTKTD